MCENSKKKYDEKRKCAKESLSFNLKNATFRKLFPEFLKTPPNGQKDSKNKSFPSSLSSPKTKPLSLLSRKKHRTSSLKSEKETKPLSLSSPRRKNHQTSYFKKSEVILSNDLRGSNTSIEIKHKFNKIKGKKGILWCDPEFPATNESITGKNQVNKKRIDVENPPKCRCGFRSAVRKVKRDTPNKGRSYVCCPYRTCKYFEWTSDKESKKYEWKRFLDRILVSDFGFRASDLRQGGVGDCWFMSALAVVAERHDLIANLFVETSRNSCDAWGLRFFLDGEWRGSVVDGRLPTVKNSRRGDRDDIAFGRTWWVKSA